MSKAAFCSSVRDDGKYAAAFEHDGEIGCYLYLCVAKNGVPNYILEALRIQSGPRTFEENDASVIWSADGVLLGLKIKGTLVAAIDVELRRKFGGDLRSERHIEIPSEIAERFDKK